MKNTIIKNLILTLILTTTLATYIPTAQAQQATPTTATTQPEKRQEIETMRAAFITNKLQLTQQESTQFWPIYTQYTQERKTLRENHTGISLKEKDLELRRQYLDQFKKVLPPTKLDELEKIEDEFKRMLLEKIKKN